jgi:hypothetical protein
MELKVSINISDTTPNPAIRTLKKWSELTDPLDLAEFSSARGAPEGQTLPQQEIYTPLLLNNGVWIGSWSVNGNSPAITNADLQRIASMQKADSYSVSDKMTHITAGGSGKWGQAIMATYAPSPNWIAAKDIRMNLCVYAGNRVEILERKVMTVDTFGTVPMVRIKTGWDQVHVYTAVTRDNVHYEEVKGRIVLPLYPKYDWWLKESWLV